MSAANVFGNFRIERKFLELVLLNFKCFDYKKKKNLVSKRVVIINNCIHRTLIMATDIWKESDKKKLFCANLNHQVRYMFSYMLSMSSRYRSDSHTVKFISGSSSFSF